MDFNGDLGPRLGRSRKEYEDYKKIVRANLYLDPESDAFSKLEDGVRLSMLGKGAIQDTI